MGDQRMQGKGAEWVRYGISLILAAIVAYFASIGAINTAVAQVREREDNHFSEVLRRLDVMQQDIRDLRDRP